MKPVAFDYERAGNLEEAVALLRRADAGAKLVSGGQSLGPMLNLRLVRPELLIDVRRLQSLRRVEESDDRILFGAALTHAEFEDGEVPDPTGGLMRHVAGGIAYRAVRNRGTIGGSLAHADPAADWLSALTAVDAAVQVRSQAGERVICLSDFVLGAFTTALAEDEMIEAVAVPRLSAASAWGYHKICRKAGEFADAIGAVVVDPERRYCRVVMGAVDGPPVLLEEMAEALAAGGAEAGLAKLDAAVEVALPEAAPAARQLHAVAVRRAIGQVYGR
ncbi:FAD binding domain-containing protein [Rhodospirillaceae bacterium SYSU D60014]|uniref:FAD binding domain-containing protein n=1 Tax=Virgifigura deserti TaxID=2268457 RepID=UPI000E66E593